MTYFSKAALMTAETVVPSDAALAFAASHNSSSTRTIRCLFSARGLLGIPSRHRHTEPSPGLKLMRQRASSFRRERESLVLPHLQAVTISRHRQQDGPALVQHGDVPAPLVGEDAGRLAAHEVYPIAFAMRRTVRRSVPVSVAILAIRASTRKASSAATAFWKAGLLVSIWGFVVVMYVFNHGVRTPVNTQRRMT